MPQMTRIWKALAAALLGGAMVLGFGASPASAQSFDDLLEQCLDSPFAPLCEPFVDDGGDDGGDGGDGGPTGTPLDELINVIVDACNQLADNTDDQLRQLCDAVGAGEQEPEPEDPTTTTAPPAPPPTDPPAPPATEAPTPTPTPTAAGAGALPSTGGTGAGVALLAGGVLAAGALALRRLGAA
jgi:LPXTG-motif cell wall-anchored protein